MSPDGKSWDTRRLIHHPRAVVSSLRIIGRVINSSSGLEREALNFSHARRSYSRYIYAFLFVCSRDIGNWMFTSARRSTNPSRIGAFVIANFSISKKEIAARG